MKILPSLTLFLVLLPLGNLCAQSTVYVERDTAVICKGESYRWHDKSYSDPGDYELCNEEKDTCYILHLTQSVFPESAVVKDSISADQTYMYVPLSLAHPTEWLYSTRWNDLAHRYGYVDVTNDTCRSATVAVPLGIMPGHTYTTPNMDPYEVDFTLTNIYCMNQTRTFHFSFTVSYTRIVRLKWDDVLGVENYAYNGGFRLMAYQWYCDGDTIGGAVTDVIYSKDFGKDSWPSGEYSVLITRSEDGVAMMTPTLLVTGTVTPPAASSEADTSPAEKILRDGRFLILRDGLIYTIDGSRVE